MSGAQPFPPGTPVGRVRAWQGDFRMDEVEGDYQEQDFWDTQGCEAIPEASGYRDQGEDGVDHSSAYGGVGWLLHPCRLKDAG